MSSFQDGELLANLVLKDEAVASMRQPKQRREAEQNELEHGAEL